VGVFFFAADFFELLLAYRTLWIRGRLGGGKTLLAFAIADHLLKLGTFVNVASNVPHDYDRPVASIRRSVVVLDEAHQVLDSRAYGKNDKSYGAYARKTDCIWLFPSVFPIDVRQRSLFVERVWALGDLLWIYKGGLELGYAAGEQFSFWLWRPSLYYGKYATRFIPAGDAGILELWQRTYNSMMQEQEETGGWSAFKPEEEVAEEVADVDAGN
jgi:hypothetical protein